MASHSIKSTYSLDVKTVRALEALARRWSVSKSEALRRAIQASASERELGSGGNALRALDKLQKSLRLDADAALRWQQAARADRAAAARRRERQGG